MGFKNFYVFSAANPLSGDCFDLILPRVNTQCMAIFLQKFSEMLEGKEVILVLDGAGWHKAKGILVPENITLVFLPPYSPELNPIERIWQHIKHHTIRNRIYHTIKSLEDEICSFLKSLSPKTVISICGGKCFVQL